MAPHAPSGATAESSRRRSKRQKNRESKNESDAEEIARLVAAAQKRLPRHKSKLIGMIYARYSSDLQQSVVDQVRELLEYAVANGIFVPLELIFWDSGIPGRKKNRPGLNAVREALENDRGQVLLVFNSSRLYRRGYQCMKFIVEDVVSEGKRAIFLKNNIDTDQDGTNWQLLLSIMSFLDDIIARLTVPNIHAAHMGLLLNCLVHGTVTYGYGGEDVPGQLRRNGKPRRRYHVVEAEAGWVLQIFRWYVVDRLPVREIVRRLNANPDVPPARKTDDGRWTRGVVLHLLANTRYRGWWQYGRTQNVWNAKKDYGRAVLREEPLKAVYFEHLRIVPDDLWYAAQKRLAALKGKYARDRKRSRRSKDQFWVLNGLFFCEAHQRPLYLQCHGKYLFCPECKNAAGEEALFSLLPKELAMRLTLDRAVRLIREDEELVARVIAACQGAAARLQRPDEGQLQAMRKEAARLGQQIHFLMENAGHTEEDRRESRAVLESLRAARTRLSSELKLAELSATAEVKVPTDAEVHEQLAHLSDVLRASDVLDEERQELLGAVLRSVTGGKIFLRQMGERKKHHGWLQGRFVSRVTAAVLERISPLASAPPAAAEVAIDYRNDITSKEEQLAERVKELYDQDLEMQEIARQLRIHVNRVTKLLRLWYERAGEPSPDNRRRFGSMRRASEDGAKYRRIAPEAARLADRGFTNGEIAAELGCSADLVGKSLKYFDQENGTNYSDRKARYELFKRRERPGRGAA